MNGYGTSNVEVILSAKDVSKKTLTKFQKNVSGLKRTVDRLAGAMVAAGGLYGVGAFGKAVFETGMEVERLNKAFLEITDSTSGVNAEFTYLRDISDQFGQNFYGLADAYKSFLAASKGTNLEGEETRRIFTAVSKASASLGLSAENTRGTLYAIQQMMSKGIVSAEELRQQLGERLPGAFNLMAEALGVTRGELDKMLKRGEILADEALPKLARVMETKYTGAVAKSVRAVNKLEESWKDLKNSFAQTGFISLVSDAMLGLAASLKEVSKAMSGLNTREQMEYQVKQLEYLLRMYEITGSKKLDPVAIRSELESLRQKLFREDDMGIGYDWTDPREKLKANLSWFAAPEKFDRLEYPTELGATSAERGHMAQTEMNRELVKAIQLQNAMALAVEDTYDIDAGIGQYSDLLDDLSDKGIETADVMRDAFTGWASSYSATLTDMIWESELTFDGILESFGRMLTQMVIQQNMTNLMGGAFDFFGAANASGGVYSGKGISAYSGQVVDKPTVFPFARGIGLMGEAGAEAILPLSRTSGGELGVKSSGKVNVIINEAPPGVSVKQQQNGDVTEIVVNLAAASVAGHGALGRVIESTYGLSRSGRRA